MLHVINNKYYLIFILISYYSIISGQCQEYKIKQITPGQGLSQSTVNCILQDKYGFMWFGTQDGLNKYDGYDFTVYKPRMHDFESISIEELKASRQADGSLPDVNFLKLKENSDLIDKGIDVGLPFLGKAPDLGAFEIK